MRSAAFLHAADNTHFSHISELGSVRNLVVSEETVDSFRVSWRAAPGAVLRYRLLYEPVGGGDKLEAQTDGSQVTIVLHELLPVTTYHVTVYPEYASGAGSSMDTEGTTKEGQHCRQALFCCFYFKNELINGIFIILSKFGALHVT